MSPGWFFDISDKSDLRCASSAEGGGALGSIRCCADHKRTTTTTSSSSTSTRMCPWRDSGYFTREPDARYTGAVLNLNDAGIAASETGVAAQDASIEQCAALCRKALNCYGFNYQKDKLFCKLKDGRQTTQLKRYSTPTNDFYLLDVRPECLPTTSTTVSTSSSTSS